MRWACSGAGLVHAQLIDHAGTSSCAYGARMIEIDRKLITALRSMHHDHIVMMGAPAADAAGRSACQAAASKEPELQLQQLANASPRP